MIAFKDFAPEQRAKAGFFRTAQYESFEAAVHEAGRWIEGENVTVINIETVVLPNMHSPHEDGSTDPELGQSSDFATAWNQFVRVWYQA